MVYNKYTFQSLHFINIDISRPKFLQVGTDLLKCKHKNGHKESNCKPKSKFATQYAENTHAATINSENFLFQFSECSKN